RKDELRVVLKCSATMISAHGVINAEMHKKGLPPLDYRISLDYGLVEIATSKSSQIEDLFGSAMNICAKINGKALANGIVIGEELFDVMSNTYEYDDYIVKSAGTVVLDLAEKEKYSIYHVESKIKNTLNPFKHKKVDEL
ncbi:MAG TPA: hypothetical protein VJR94_00515, partial [Candidatus Nitrosocosmicus sp.]|nr:hypothetical protein [Candidatus Nitrosocosmicus sp.]